eukprot:767090-Hanusia_phi.AAC.1
MHRSVTIGGKERAGEEVGREDRGGGSLLGSRGTSRSFPVFEDWLTSRPSRDLSSSSSVKETRTARLRRQIKSSSGERRHEADGGGEFSDVLPILTDIEKRIRGKIEENATRTSFLGVESLLKELPLYDHLFQDVLDKTDVVFPIASQLLRSLWESFVRMVKESSKLYIERSSTVMDENVILNREIKLSMKTAHDRHKQVVELQSALTKTQDELTLCKKQLQELQQNMQLKNSWIRERGREKDSREFPLATTLKLLEEAEETQDASLNLLDEIEELFQVRVEEESRSTSARRASSQQVMARWRAEVVKLQQQNEAQRVELRAAEEEVRRVTDLAQKYLNLYEGLRDRNQTPRPDWDGIYERVCPQLSQLQMVSLTYTLPAHEAVYKGSTADRVQLISELLARLLPSEHLAAQPEVTKSKFFEPRGAGRQVPPYLRSKNPVRNRSISKRETHVLVQGIVNSRYKRRGGTKGISLEEHVFEYLKSRCQFDFGAAVELGYNLMEGCRKYLDDPMLFLFKGVIDGTGSEDLLHDLVLLVEDLAASMREAGEKRGKSEAGLSAEEVEEVVRAQYPLKDRHKIRREVVPEEEVE